MQALLFNTPLLPVYKPELTPEQVLLQRIGRYMLSIDEEEVESIEMYIYTHDSTLMESILAHMATFYKQTGKRIRHSPITDRI